MKPFRVYTLFFLICLCFLTACEKNESNTEEYRVIAPVSPQDKGSRIFGINISESSQGFQTSFDKATEAGIQVVEINLPWSSIETAEGEYTNPNGIFTALEFYGSKNIKVAISLAVINTVKWEVPGYLENTPSNDPSFIEAFNNLVDWVLDTIPESVVIPSISIGNEVDLVLSTDEDWSQYTSFYEVAANYIHTNYPDIKVGVKTTIMGGLFGDEKSKIQLINVHSDVVMLNYYPQNQIFEVLDPDIPLTHFGEIVTAFPQKPVWLTEVGYQSGNQYCKSSEIKQAQFYHHLFTAWDEYKDRIEFVVIDWLHDQSPETIEEWKNYYGNDPALIEYLSTLGLRNYNDTDKSAWLQLKTETKARGWSE